MVNLLVWCWAITFLRSGLQSEAASCCGAHGRGTVFGYQVMDPERFGVVEFDEISALSRWKKSQNSRSQTGRYRALFLRQ